MNEKRKGIFWIVLAGILGALASVVTIISGIIAIAQQSSFFQVVGSVFVWIGNAFVAFITFGVPVWAIIIGIAVFIFIIWLYDKSQRFLSPTIDWLQYTSEDYREWRFRWNWARQPDGKYSINNLIPHCHNCNCVLSKVSDVERTYNFVDGLYCPNPDCNRKYTVLGPNTLLDVEKVVMANITNGTYRDRIANLSKPKE